MLLRCRLFPVLLVAVLLLPGCGALPSLFKKKPVKGAATGPLFVGTVTLVSEDPSFVLIDNGTLPPPSAGTVLTISNSGSPAVEMKVTHIQKPPFVVADIVKGMPKKGDRVFR
jgi:hypothetical protein